MNVVEHVLVVRADSARGVRAIEPGHVQPVEGINVGPRLYSAFWIFESSSSSANGLVT
jgi:hypothetical protein